MLNLQWEAIRHTGSLRSHPHFFCKMDLKCLLLPLTLIFTTAPPWELGEPGGPCAQDSGSGRADLGSRKEHTLQVC